MDPKHQMPGIFKNLRKALPHLAVALVILVVVAWFAFQVFERLLQFIT